MTPFRLRFSLTAVLLLALSGYARAQVPQHLNHQGLLTDNAGVIVQDGEYRLRFEIHATPDVESLRFSQELNVNVVKGLYNVLLSDNGGGSLAGAFDGATRYLQIEIVTSPQGTYNDLVLSPRQQIASVPYALVAGRVTDGSTQGPPYPPGHLHGLILVRTAGDSVQIQPGSCRDSGDQANLALQAALTKRIDSPWVAGDGTGGFPQTQLGGPRQPGTWYHVFLIRDASGTIDAGYDTSVMAEHLLQETGYTSYRRIGSVRTDGSSSIIDFRQEGDWFEWTAPASLTLDHDETAKNFTSGVDVPLENAPPSLRSLVKIAYAIHGLAQPNGVAFFPGDATTAPPNISASPLASAFSDNEGKWGGNLMLLTDAGDPPLIKYRVAMDTSTDLRVLVLGWLDDRGRNA